MNAGAGGEWIGNEALIDELSVLKAACLHSGDFFRRKANRRGSANPIEIPGEKVGTHLCGYGSGFEFDMQVGFRQLILVALADSQTVQSREVDGRLRAGR